MSDKDISEIGFALFLYSPTILFSGLNTIIHRAFQSMKTWVTPLLVGVSTVAMHFGLSYIFVFHTQLNYHGVALSFSIVSFINFATLYMIIQRKMKVSIKADKIIKSIIKTIVSATFMGLLLFFVKDFILNIIIFNNMYLNRICLFFLTVIAGVIVYISMMVILREDTFMMLVKRIFKRGENKNSS